MKAKFFYNYTVHRRRQDDSFCYGIMTLDDAKEDTCVDEAFEFLKKESKEKNPNDDVNITAFNRV